VIELLLRAQRGKKVGREGRFFLSRAFSGKDAKEELVIKEK